MKKMNNAKRILRVKADKDLMKEMYSKLSKVMGFIERFEKSLRERSIYLLNLKQGERILEIGFGRGTALLQLAREVGSQGYVYGIDLTPEMVRITGTKVLNSDLDNISIEQGDARDLPYKCNYFDAVYIASTLELFDNPDIPIVLSEIKRVLKTDGRLCVVSIPKENRERTLSVRLNEFYNKTFEKYASCRPIYLEHFLKIADFRILHSEELGFLFTMKIVLAKPQ
ncbi:MAG: methyltransferase domain-containing protein [Candidatus Lokiarchaeota archaeon]|nr:methyltransferase domain-containing protein [Candidatus Lokiarchaeota archaeon]